VLWEFILRHPLRTQRPPDQALRLAARLALLARAGAGLTLADERRIRDESAPGELVAVLEEFSPPFPGFYLYYPQRRQASRALVAFVAYLRDAKRA